MLPPSNRGLTAQIEAELLIFDGTGLLRFSLTKPFSPAARKAVKRYSCKDTKIGYKFSKFYEFCIASCVYFIRVSVLISLE